MSLAETLDAFPLAQFATTGPQLQAVLARYGLESLAGWASSMIILGAAPEEIELGLWDRPEFKARFPAIFAREQAGLPPLSPDEYLSYESFASQSAKAFGVTLTRDDTNALLTADVSTQELETRLGFAAKAVYQSSPELRSRLQAFYGIGTGDLVRYWLDPRKEAPVLERRFAAAQIAGEAQTAGFRRDLSVQQAEGLFERGLDPERAREAFGALVQADELFAATDRTEQEIGLEDQLRLITGDEGMVETVQRRGQRRAAAFQGGGTFASGREGLAGLGSAAT